MTKEEKILLVELLLRDIRGNWVNSDERVKTAYNLCKELSIDKLYGKQFKTLAKEILNWDKSDGRYFRDEFPYGYVMMGYIHKLPYTYKDRSDEFKKMAELLTYPEYLFTDWIF